MTLREIADLVSGRVAPENETLQIHGPASLVEAGSGDITFFGNAKYLSALRTTQACAVLVPYDCLEEIAPARVWVDNPSEAFAKILAHFAPEPISYPPAFIRRRSLLRQHASTPPRMSARGQSSKMVFTLVRTP